MPLAVRRMLVVPGGNDYITALCTFLVVCFVSIFSVRRMRFKIQFVGASRASVPVSRTFFSAVLRCGMLFGCSVSRVAHVADGLCCAGCRSARAVDGFFMFGVPLAGAGVRIVSVA